MRTHPAPQFPLSTIFLSEYKTRVSGSTIMRKELWRRGFSHLSGTVYHVIVNVTIGDGTIRSSNCMCNGIILCSS